MKKVLVCIIIFTLVLSISISATPGDSSDPIVVLSYLNQRIKNLINDYKLDKLATYETAIDENKKIIEENNKKIDELKQQLENINSGTTELEVVTLTAGQKLIAGAGTEIILRSGDATAIASNLGGLSDVTLASDIQQGAQIAKNHLLIVPRDDGRGVYSPNGAILMVRGKYTIE